MGDFNHGNIKWDSLQSTGVEDQMCVCLVQDNFLTQHVCVYHLFVRYNVGTIEYRSINKNKHKLSD